MLNSATAFPEIARPTPSLDTTTIALLPPSPLSDPLAASLSLAGSSTDVKEIAFIDGGLSDYQTLVDGLKPGTAMYVLDPLGDEVGQISRILAGYSGLSAVSIFSHGSDGDLQLGNSHLNTTNLLDYAGMLQSWSGAFAAGADLLLFGCNVAADAIGQNFISQIATLTGADVAASTDLTGSSALGGDWELEFATGSIESSEVLAGWAQVAYQNVLATYTVNNLNDSGADSLRQAILDANTSTGVADTINFNVTGTITLTSELLLTDSAATTITGAGAITVSGGGNTRVFQIAPGASASLSGLTISGGSADLGGGIYNNGGTVNVSNSTFSGNSATGSQIGVGGAIANINFSSIPGTVNVSNSTFSGNSATNAGGGIFNGFGSTVNVSNSTLSGNSAGSSGGGIFNNPDASSPVNLSNSIVAGNTADTGREIYISGNTFTSGGYNLLGESSETTAAALVGFTPTTSDIVATSDGTTPTALDAILNTTLANNGGPTQTLALVAGSPAIDAGNTALTTDQRGIARPQGSADDIGAFELEPPPNTAPNATDDGFTVAEDNTLTVTAAGGVLANDTDADSNPLTASLVTGPINGTLTFNSNGSFVYKPNANFNGTDSFTYRVDDGTVNSNIATVKLTVTPVNDAPVATGETLTDIAEDSGVRTISFASLLSNDNAGPNETGQTLTVTGVNNVVGGTAVISGTDILFTPTANYNGLASFQYTIQDNGTTNGVADFKTASATATFNITPVNDAPVVTAPASVSVQSGGSAISGIQVSDVDITTANANTASFTTTLTVTNGTLSFSSLASGVSVAGQGTGTITLNGTLAQINATLVNLRYSGGSFTGDTTLNVTVNDNGNTGSGGNKTASSNIALQVARNFGTLGNSAVTVSGTVSNTNQIDYYQFSLSGPTKKFRLTLGNLTANADVAVYRVNPDGSKGALAFDYKNRSGTQAEVINNQQLVGSSTNPVTYLIEVKWVDGVGSTPYNLSFNA